MKALIFNVNIICDEKKSVYGAVLIQDGIILDVIKNEELELGQYADVQLLDGNGCNLLPGFIDIHLHGSYGYDFVENPESAINHVSSRLPEEGTTSFLASLTLLAHNDLCALLSQYAGIDKSHGAEFLGVHSEGPFISKEYKALMNEQHILPPSGSSFLEMIESTKGKLRVVTVAPELFGMDEIYSLAKKHDISLMIGHTACTCKEALSAIENGAKGFTHLYNAMTQHSHRSPGAVTAAFLSQDSFCEIIVDGFHVDLDVVLATYKALTSKRLVLVSDAMLGRGMDDGVYEFSDLKCKKTGNTVQVIETGRIAGSCITMLDAAQLMLKTTNCTLGEIVEMASINPAKVINCYHKKGSIEKGKDADFILLDDNFNLHSTFVKGKKVYTSA